jgi:hypothetical protein
MTDQVIHTHIPDPMNEAEVKKFYTWLKSMLPMGPMTVTFTKADGTERVMKCTLDPELLPKVEPKPITEDKKPRKESDKAIRVFDLDKQEWRSFTVTKVKRIQFEI